MTAIFCLMPELGYLGRKEVASIAGVAKECGKAVGYRRIIDGRSNVRSKLFTAAISVARSKSVLGGFYSQLNESGKNKMVVTRAPMRKILVIANTRLKETINLHTPTTVAEIG